MDYQLMSDPGALLDDADVASDAGRELLFAEPFDDLGAVWRVYASEAHPRSSAMNEGKAGEIYGLANTCIFVERDLPAGARLIEATFDVGTDRSASWGPGIGLVLPDRTVKFNLRTGSMEAGIHDGRGRTSDDAAAGCRPQQTGRAPHAAGSRRSAMRRADHQRGMGRVPGVPDRPARAGREAPHREARLRGR
jgi:hypothetical protein